VKPRVVTHQYRDPLSEVWLATAHRIGLSVQRSPDAFAHSDGKGRLFLATDEHLDADDSIAQMIFHELCHSLVEGPDAFEREDWGLDNTSEIHHQREHATLKVQAVLAGRHGLREVFGPTTDFRAYYDELGADPLDDRSSPSTAVAIVALRRSNTAPWAPHLQRALAASAELVSVSARFAAPADAPSLYRRFRAIPDPHPAGLPPAPGAHRCGQCAWRLPSGQCRQTEIAVEPEWPACERYEAPFDCQDCGACCRAAYHSVTLAEGDATAERHPDLVVQREGYLEMKRDGDHCIALVQRDGRYACTIYDDRPTCCREFEHGGEHCLTARRRVGLSL
jgi:hypothetical protein